MFERNQTNHSWHRDAVTQFLCRFWSCMNRHIKSVWLNFVFSTTSLPILINVYFSLKSIGIVEITINCSEIKKWLIMKLYLYYIDVEQLLNRLVNLFNLTGDLEERLFARWIDYCSDSVKVFLNSNFLFHCFITFKCRSLISRICRHLRKCLFPQLERTMRQSIHIHDLYNTH